MDAPDREKAEAILHHHEHEAASRSTLNPGCTELLKWLDAQSIGRALITRNTRKSVRTVFDRCGLHFDVAITREDGEFKPDPAPLRHACAQLGVSTDEVWMVGDWKYDIEAANNANVHGVWLSFGRERVFDAVPDRVVYDLNELFETLKRLADQAV
ncbi:MAG: HAD-IA family hydrolase [Tepidisphaeraceae bacterium]